MSLSVDIEKRLGDFRLFFAFRFFFLLFENAIIFFSLKAICKGLRAECIQG